MKLKKIISLLAATVMVITAIPVNAQENKKAVAPVTISVGKGSGYDFNTIKEALDSITVTPTEYNSATINIDKGVYEEDITVNIPYVHFVNESKGDVIITNDKANGHADSSKNFGTQKSATVTIDKSATGFNAENITFKNGYNIDFDDREQTQAVALVSLADKVVFDNCKFLGRQDTLYLKGASKGQDVYGSADNARVYLKNCYIEGTVDFIFGDATAFFEKCKLNMAYSEKGGHFTAPNTTLFNTGFVFDSCTLTVDPKYTSDLKNKIDLGRPWQSDGNYPNYGSQSVYINCTMPAILNPDGFRTWNEDTVVEKIRFYEYGSKNTDMSYRASFVKKLSDEQAAAYSRDNVLGSWNPDMTAKKTSVKVSDITLDKYDIKLPMGTEDTLKPYVLPDNSSNKTVTYKSSDESIVSVDKNGKLKALDLGKAVITAETAENNFSVTAKVEVIAPRTDIPKVTSAKIEHKDEILPNDSITFNYNYELDSDKKIDKALIRWSAVDPDTKEEILIKEGRGEDAKKYDVRSEDGGYFIKASVFPETTTTYGKYGTAVEAATGTSVTKKSNAAYLREGFNDLHRWKVTNSAGKTTPFASLDDRGNKLVTNENDEKGDFSLMEYNKTANEKNWNNAEYELRMRFNPTLKGWDGDSYFDFYTDYNGKDSSYYKYRLVRGGNTNSLKAYLYRKENGGEETLIGSDEKALSNVVAQNSGENNPWFRIKIKTENNKLSALFINDDDMKTLSTIFYKETAPLNSGFAAIECYGRGEALLLDTLNVIGKDDLNTENSIRVYLAGDSTVKSWGADNSIGGWGEYLKYYFNDNVKIINKSEGGRSTRSYINQGRLDEILSEIRPNDFMFIQLGTNDARTDANAFLEHSVEVGTPDSNGIYPSIAGKLTETPQDLYQSYLNAEYGYKETYYPYKSGTYKWYLRQYVEKAREKGAIPVLITPVSRVFFDENGKIKPHHGENDAYVECVKQVAAETNTILIDMFAITKELYESYGQRVTESIQNIKDDGSMDITHYNKFGSNIIASKLVAELARQGISIAQDSIASRKAVSKTEDIRKSDLYVVGDDAAAKYYKDDSYSLQKNGWGEYIGDYFVDRLTVHNYAKQGESIKTFTESENYDEVFYNIKSGDYLMINFGESDSVKKDTSLDGDKDKAGSFKYYLYEYYIKPASEIGAVPIIITPARERVFNADGTAAESYGEYSKAIAEVAAELGTGYVNLNEESAAMYNELGKDGCKIFSPLYKDKTMGSQGYDNSNLNDYGADMIAAKIASQLKFSSVTLKNYENDAAENKANNNFITKAEFADKLTAVLGYNYEIYVNFSDVEKGKPYYNGVGVAKSIGAAVPDANGNFNPEEPITKSEAEFMVTKALKANSYDISEFVSGEGDILTKEEAGKIFCSLYDIYR